MTPGSIERTARLIQLAVAPIFLLTAVATTLTVLAGRLTRIVDRGRFLETKAAPANDFLRGELDLIESRARLIYRGLSLGVLAAILVSLLMAIAFMGEVFLFNAAKVAASLFIAALFSYTGALVCLLREVFLALGSFRLGLHHASPSKLPPAAPRA